MRTTDISKIDSNFAVNTNINKDDIVYYGVDSLPFKVYGIFKDNEKYRRMPEDVAKSVSDGVYSLHTNTAGGRVKFVTDSAYIAIYAKMGALGKMSHFALSGSCGFDLYADNMYTKTFIPPYNVTEEFGGIVEFGTLKTREITINFPLYSGVNELYIGLQKDCIIKEAPKYKSDKPIVYYGSSITQGGCASRPGMSYEAIVSRRFNYDYINLGFSGNAKAEDEIIEYIGNLDMEAFVYDYDHNAPSVEHLKNTHEKMFKKIRKKHPDIPIIIMSRPKHFLEDIEKERLCIIEATYNNAVYSGDENVYLLNGKNLTELCNDEGTVDGCHPTDFGFVSMANAVCKVFEKINM